MFGGEEPKPRLETATKQLVTVMGGFLKSASC